MKNTQENFVVDSIVTKKDLMFEDMVNLIVTALEGGINHWASAGCLDSLIAQITSEKDLSYSEACAHALFIHNSYLSILDEESEKMYSISKEDIVKGLALYMSSEQFYSGRDLSDFDAYDADCVIQCAVFDEVTIG
jgi:hypothetical protein